MTRAQERALEMIRAQQKKAGEGSTVWCAGEQLADIAMEEPESAELLARDLELPEMSIEKAEGKIRAYADKNRKGGVRRQKPEGRQELRRLAADRGRDPAEVLRAAGSEGHPGSSTRRVACAAGG